VKTMAYCQGGGLSTPREYGGNSIKTSSVNIGGGRGDTQVRWKRRGAVLGRERGEGGPLRDRSSSPNRKGKSSRWAIKDYVLRTGLEANERGTQGHETTYY